MPPSPSKVAALYSASSPPRAVVQEVSNILTQHIREDDEVPLMILKSCRTLQDLVRHRIISDQSLDGYLRDGAAGDWALYEPDPDRAFAALEQAVAAELMQMGVIGPHAEEDLEPGDE